MRTVVRNSYARQTVVAERVRVTDALGLKRAEGCAFCGSFRQTRGRDGHVRHAWLYRFHVEDDSGPRASGPVADGRAFCSRECCERYIGRAFDETRTGG